MRARTRWLGFLAATALALAPSMARASALGSSGGLSVPDPETLSKEEYQLQVFAETFDERNLSTGAPDTTADLTFVYNFGVYDTLELERNLDGVVEILEAVIDPLADGTAICSSQLHRWLGDHLREHREGRGILQSAAAAGVAIYAPAFTDSELGIDFAHHNYQRVKDGRGELRYDPFADLQRFVEWTCAQEKLGIFTIGGGVPRNWAQEVGPYVELMHSRHGEGPATRRYKYAVRICPEPVHWGGLSGCTYTEGVSWGKFEPRAAGGRHVEVYSDATIAWPLIVKAVMERLDADPPGP